MDTKIILLVIAPDRQSTEGFHWCLHTAAQSKRKIRVAYVHPKSQSADSIKKTIDEIERQCRTFQVSFETLSREGNYLSVSEELSKKEDVDILVLVEKPRSFLGKWFAESEFKKMAPRILCEIKTYLAD